jgi:hypothetical protein
MSAAESRRRLDAAAFAVAVQSAGRHNFRAMPRRLQSRSTPLRKNRRRSRQRVSGAILSAARWCSGAIRYRSSGDAADPAARTGKCSRPRA